MFQSAPFKLKLTCEFPDALGSLHFLDISLRGIGRSLCWQYLQRTEKALLPFDSAHSRMVKSGMAASVLKSSTVKSCHHMMSGAFATQVERLRSAGFREEVILQSAKKVYRDMRKKKKDAAEKGRPVLIPYAHRISHKVRKAGAQFGVQVEFTCDNKLASLPRKINRPKAVCGKKHERQFTECKSGVVYQIVFTCGRVYIGQSGRCINDRLREHANSIVNRAAAPVSMHVQSCGCQALLDEVQIRARHRGRRGREIIEAVLIKEKGQECVSNPSVALSAEELEFLR